MIRMWSRHSRRRVPMKRSAIAFARGARTGVAVDPDVGAVGFQNPPHGA